MIGSVTSRRTAPGDRPSVRATSSIRGLTWRSEARVTPTASGTKRTR